MAEGWACVPRDAWCACRQAADHPAAARVQPRPSSCKLRCPGKTLRTPALPLQGGWWMCTLGATSTAPPAAAAARVGASCRRSWKGRRAAQLLQLARLPTRRRAGMAGAELTLRRRRLAFAFAFPSLARLSSPVPPRRAWLPLDGHAECGCRGYEAALEDPHDGLPRLRLYL